VKPSNSAAATEKPATDKAENKPAVAPNKVEKPQQSPKWQGEGYSGHYIPIERVVLMGRPPKMMRRIRQLRFSVIRSSIMIHSGGDNYSDQPAPLGGGGARIACGVVM
jgi:superoxide dismutase, Cu-Zn family